jgi:hypothetical protein
MNNIYKFLIVALLMVFSFGVANVDAQTIKERFDGILVDHDADINGDLDVDGTAYLDTVDIDGDLTIGADGLYPLGYATSGQQIVCGTTATFTTTTTVAPTGLTVTDYVIASQITTPAAGAAFMTVSDPTTSTFVISTWESDYTAGTTGITAHWCAIGDQ